MKIPEKPHLNSYEAALTDEQRAAFRAVLLSGITLAEAQQKAPPWPGGTEQGKPPSLTSLFRARCRLRIQEKVARIEDARIATRATRTLLRRLVQRNGQVQRAGRSRGAARTEADRRMPGPRQNRHPDGRSLAVAPARRPAAGRGTPRPPALPDREAIGGPEPAAAALG